MAKTNKELVEYCRVQIGRPYWYGTFGNTATKSLLATKRKQYPNYYAQKKYRVNFEEQIGERVHDCIGLIKGYLWSETPNSAPKYNAAQDFSANQMLGKCKKSGKISSLPEVPGTLVFFSGHVGVYIGDGWVIEARGHDYGVVKTKLKNRPWTDWGFCPFIEYPEEKKEEPARSTGYFPSTKYSGVSIVDALKSIGVDSSRAYRVKIAKVNGITPYLSTSSQNLKMLDLLKKGELKKP